MVSNVKVGTVFRGRYLIEAELGEGGFAKVFRAKDEQLKRVVALKILKVTAGDTDVDLERFRREARVLAQLSHKNIVSIYSIDLIENASPLIVMEHLSGKPLQQFLKERTPLDQRAFCELFSQICSGLAFAHNQGVVHRDLGPHNIFIENENPIAVKIIDFGLARLIADTDKYSLTVTATGAIVGSPLYMSPEQTKGEKLDNRSDIYSLGCIVYEAISGRTAFDSNNLLNALQQHQSTYPESPLLSLKKQDSYTLYADIALKCMQKDKAKRFQTCEQIQTLLLEGAKDRHNELLIGLDPWKDERPVRFINPGILLPFLTIVLLTILVCCYGPMGSVLILKLLPNNYSQSLKRWTAQRFSERYPSEAAILYSDLLSDEMVKRDPNLFSQVCLDDAACLQRLGDFKASGRILSTALTTKGALPSESFLTSINSLINNLSNKEGFSLAEEVQLRASLLRSALDSKAKKTLTKSLFEELLYRTNDLVNTLYTPAPHKQDLLVALTEIIATLRQFPSFGKVESVEGPLQRIANFTDRGPVELSSKGAAVAALLIPVQESVKTAGELKLTHLDNLALVDHSKAYLQALDYLAKPDSMLPAHRFYVLIKAAKLAPYIDGTQTKRLFSEAERMYETPGVITSNPFFLGVDLYREEFLTYPAGSNDNRVAVDKLFGLMRSIDDLLHTSASVFSLERKTGKFNPSRPLVEDDRTHASLMNMIDVFVRAKDFQKADALIKRYIALLRASRTSIYNTSLLVNLLASEKMPQKTQQLLKETIAMSQANNH